MNTLDPEYRGNRKYAAIGVVLFSAGLVAILLLTGLRFQEPPPEEMGVEVNLGNSDQGMGVIQPQVSETASQATSAPVDAQDQYVTQDVEEAPVATPTRPVTRPQQTQPEPQPDPQPTLDPRLTYSGRTSSGGSEGTTGNPGDQGQPGGNPNSGNYTGTPGAGGGPSFSLSGRKASSLPLPSRNFSESGVVVVKIWVDRQGKVARALAGAPGTTASSATLRKLAEQAAYQAQFNPDPDAQFEQVGTITYNFRIN